VCGGPIARLDGARQDCYLLSQHRCDPACGPRTLRPWTRCKNRMEHQSHVGVLITLAMCSVICVTSQHSPSISITCSAVQQAVSDCLEIPTSDCAICLNAITQFGANQTRDVSVRKNAQRELFYALVNNSTLAAKCTQALFSPHSVEEPTYLWIIMQSPSAYCSR
jgi:hypothetical protein